MIFFCETVAKKCILTRRRPLPKNDFLNTFKWRARDGKKATFSKSAKSLRLARDSPLQVKS